MKSLAKALSRIRVEQAVWLLIGLVLAAGIGRAASWSESPAFCGLCHVMTPEVRAHAASAHAGVLCGDCHAAPGLIGFLESKLGSLREFLLYVTGQYHLPIVADPASLPDTALTCQRCHPLNGPDAAPQLIVIPRYLNDATNSRLNLYYTLDLDRVHWHVTHPVTYLLSGEGIPWVSDGTRAYSVTMTLPTGVLVRMNCATCHNRAGHPLHTPEALLDAALAQGRLSAQVPYLRSEALKALSVAYPDTATALTALSHFTETYRTAYPTLYPSYAAELEQAAQLLPELYLLSVFPEYGVTGESYPDHTGHEGGAGCFRCHDGKHLSADGQRVTRNCTACHGIPQLKLASDPVPSASFLPPPQPASHQASDWINQHGKLKDESCAHCHAPTFCTNALCHGALQVQP